MSVAQYDFEIIQGATFTQPFVWKDGDGDPVDLTGYAARMQVRKSVQAKDVLLEATTANGRIVIYPLTGTFTLSLPAAVTESLDWLCGRYDIELVASDGFVVRILEGTVSVSREITRD